jgi:hypothetical protein
MTKSLITPKSKVLQVIEDYPQLEDVLINYVPAFKNLKNPILRKTVARVATLQQAAAIGNVKVEELINHLRKEVGQDLFTDSTSKDYNLIKPVWYAPEKIVTEFNAKELLAKGEHPVNQVMADLKALQTGAIYKFIAPFMPAPLIDKASGLEVEHWIVKETDESYIIYFHKS